MTSADDKMMTPARADVAELLARVARETAKAARENCVAYTGGT